MKKLHYHKNGFVLASTLVVFLIFSSFFTQLGLHQFHLKQQGIWYHQAKEISFIHLDIVKYVLSEDQINSFSSHNHLIEIIQVDDENFKAIVSGDFNFSVEIGINLDNHRIKSYNYTDF